MSSWPLCHEDVDFKLLRGRKRNGKGFKSIFPSHDNKLVRKTSNNDKLEKVSLVSFNFLTFKF